jgi:hypothetical protein
MTQKGNQTMMKLSTRTKNLIPTALTLMLGLSLFAASTANATRCDEYEVVHAETPFDDKAHKHLDVVCREHWQAISCEPAIGGQNDSYNHGYNYLSQEVIAINENHPVQFSEHHGHEYHGHYGCHFRANNFLAIFAGYKFEWKLGGYATCVPTHCVNTSETHWYGWDSRDIDLF